MLLIFLILTLFVLNILWQTVSSDLLGTSNSNFEVQSEDQFSLLYTKDHEKCESSSFSKVEVTLFMASNLRNGKRYLSTRSSDEISYSLSYQQQQHISSNNLHLADNQPNTSPLWIFQNETFNDLTPTWCLFKDKDLSYSLTLTHDINIDKEQQKPTSIVGVLLCGEYFVSLNQKYEINYNMLTLCQTFSQHKNNNKFVSDDISLKPLSNSNNVFKSSEEDSNTVKSYFGLRSLPKLTAVTSFQNSINHFIQTSIEFIRSSIPSAFFSSSINSGTVDSNSKLRDPLKVSSAPSPMPTSLPTSLPSSYPSPQPSSQPSSMPTNIPSSYPTPEPSSYPSNAPTYRYNPSPQPTSIPSNPTTAPTIFPSNPSVAPSIVPTATPSISLQPTTYSPTVNTTSITEAPTTNSSDTGAGGSTLAFVQTASGIGTIAGAGAAGVGGVATAAYYVTRASKMVKAPLAAVGQFNI